MSPLFMALFAVATGMSVYFALVRVPEVAAVAAACAALFLVFCLDDLARHTVARHSDEP